MHMTSTPEVPSITAIGGTRDSAGAPSSRQVVVHFAGETLTIFTANETHVFHALFVDRIMFGSHEAFPAQVLVVTSGNQGCMIPTMFAPAEQLKLDALIAAVSAARARLL